MLTGTNIVDLFDFYLEEYCPEELIILEGLKQKLLEELKVVSDNLKRTTLKDLPKECYILQRELDIYKLLGDGILDSCLSPNLYNLKCSYISDLRKIFYIIPRDIDSEMISIINYDTGKIMGRKNSYPELRKAWTNYLSFSIDLMSGMLNFLICLEANKETFTEGRVKDLIRKYGSNRRYKV
jgi:hypothetical protein